MPKSNDPHGNLYDFDASSHIIIVLDWLHQTSLDKFLLHHHSDGDNKPETLLVNGRGYFKTTNETENVPASRFHVEKVNLDMLNILAKILNVRVFISGI